MTATPTNKMTPIERIVLTNDPKSPPITLYLVFIVTAWLSSSDVLETGYLVCGRPSDIERRPHAWGGGGWCGDGSASIVDSFGGSGSTVASTMSARGSARVRSSALRNSCASFADIAASGGIPFISRLSRSNAIHCATQSAAPRASVFSFSIIAMSFLCKSVASAVLVRCLTLLVLTVNLTMRVFTDFVNTIRCRRPGLDLAGHHVKQG